METIKRKAEEIAREAGGKKMGIDPATAIMLIEIAIKVVTALVKAYRECKKKPDEAAASMRQPRLPERRRLKKLAREHAGEEVSVEKLHQAAIKVAAGVTDAEVEQMYAEVDA